MKLLPYQKAWLNDQSRFKIWLKARQIGYSTTIAYEALTESLDNKVPCLLVSASEKQSLELMEKVYNWVDYIQSMTGQRIINEKTRQKTECHPIDGAIIKAMPSNPKTIRGFTGSVFLDELAFHQDSWGVWAAVMPMTLREENKKYRIFIGSTPGGEKDKFYQLWQSSKIFSKHRLNIYEAIEQGLQTDIDRLKELCGDPEIFAQEFECTFLSDLDTYFSLPLIHTCVDGSLSPLGPEHDFLDTIGKQVTIGVDVGRKRDLTVITVLEEREGINYFRKLTELKGVKFADQEAHIGQHIETYSPYLVNIDNTGIGMQLAENLSDRYPCVEGVTFTNASKENMVSKTKQAFEQRTVRIPDDHKLISDINSIYRKVTHTGKICYDSQSSSDGHADRFWSVALAVLATEGRICDFKPQVIGDKRATSSRSMRSFMGLS